MGGVCCSTGEEPPECPLPELRPCASPSLLASRASTPRDVPRAPGGEAEACGCLVPWAGPAVPSVAPQAPAAPPLRALLGQLWDGPGLTPRRCCRHGACPGASAPRGFAEELSKCVQVRVRPNNVSVTSPGVQVSGAEREGVEARAHVLGALPALGPLLPPADRGHKQRAGPQCGRELCLRGGDRERGRPAALWRVTLSLAFPAGAPGSHPGARSVAGPRGAGLLSVHGSRVAPLGSLQGPRAPCSCSCSPRRAA